MKKVLYVFIVLAINTLLTPNPIFADDKDLNDYAVKGQRGSKDECLLMASNCPIPDYKLQERINRLRDEIDRGTSVYTLEEIQRLIRKLEDARATQDFFNSQAPSMPY